MHKATERKYLEEDKKTSLSLSDEVGWDSRPVDQAMSAKNPWQLDLDRRHEHIQILLFHCTNTIYPLCEYCLSTICYCITARPQPSCTVLLLFMHCGTIHIGLYNKF
jgi:hypothetical protein